MKIFSFDDIKSMNISPATCYEWVSDMILHKKEAQLPAKIHMTMPENIFCNVMPCIVHGNAFKAMGGVKVVTRYPMRKPSLDSKLLLFNAESGDFLAMMDANWITAMRTGAVAAHSVLNLAKENFSTIGMLGLGNTARASLLVLAAMVDRDINVKLLRYKDQAELFIERFKDFPHLHFDIVDHMEDLVRGSEVVISCATYFENDIALDSWFDKGVTVIPVHTRGFTNCDLFFDKVFADDTGHVDHFKNFHKFKYYAEVSDVMNGLSVGREHKDERILAYNIGIAMHDIYFAACIYNMNMEDSEVFHKLTDIDMHDPIEKFWI